MISSHVPDSQAPPLRSPLHLEPHGLPPGPPPAQIHNPLSMPPQGIGSLHSLQSLNSLGIGVGYAMPMQMAPFRPLYVPAPEMGAADPALTKSKGKPVVGKRMKVSRACDECRRKKTRCDIDSESDVCSLCRRANVMCTFARQQLKRGPARKRSSQPSISNGSPPAVVPQRSRSRSTSDTRRGKESPVLPPIESLLSYQKPYPTQATPIPIPQRQQQQQQQQQQHSYGHDPQVSPPIVDYATPIQPAAGLAASPPQHTSPYAVQQQTLKKDLSGFPVLVEVACSQEKEAGHQTSPASKASPPLSLVDSATGVTTGKAPTPPHYYDGALHGVLHQALTEYYTFCHPTFPILPNSIAEFDAVFRDATSMRQCLVAAINSSVDGADSPDSASVPFGQSSSRASAADREAHLMALLFVYVRTLEYTWLGAAVAECAALNAEPLNPRTERLTALIAVFDRLHGITFGTRSLFPADLHSVAMRYAPIVPTLTALLTPAAPATIQDRFHTAPEIVLATLGQLGSPSAPVQELLATLETLAPQVQHTPLAKFVEATLSQHRTNPL